MIEMNNIRNVRSVIMMSGLLLAMIWPNEGTVAQGTVEQERDLVAVSMAAAEWNARGLQPVHSIMQSRGGSLSLPFFDDFSTPSIPSLAGTGFEEYHRWVDASARITATFALSPPSIGVATLEGLSATGYPYSFNEVNTPGWADTLTSRPLALNGYFPESAIHVMFYYQGGGRGNAPDPGEDILALEFKSEDDVTGEIFWTEVWSSDSAETDAFERVFVPVDNPIHLTNGFQFRFRNFGALGGNVDMWHIDYVLVDDQLDPETFEISSEVTFTEPMHSLLRDFTRMPWTHYQTNPSLYMGDSVTTFHRNLSPTQADNIETGIVIDYEGTLTEFDNFFQNTNVQPESSFTTGFYVGNNPVSEDIAFDATVNDSCASFQVSFWESSIGLMHMEKVGVPDNDSIVFTQVFSNDFAYDDGSAEKAYSITSAGGKMAMRFSLAQPDTLLGLAIHFTPFYTNSDAETFLLRAWEDDGGSPGEELGENFQFHTPQYFTDGYDLFAFYAYDQPIPVEGVVHVGMVQGSDALLNFGLDKNTHANVGQLHYQLGLGGSWLASEIDGSVMIRPVLRAGKETVWNELTEVSNESEVALVYPNPSESGIFHITSEEGGDWRIFSSTGQLMATGEWPNAGTYAISAWGWPPGLYVIHGPWSHPARIMIR